MQSNYSTAKGSSAHRKRYRNNGYTDHDNPLHRPRGASKAGLDQTFAKEAASDHLLHKEAPAAAPTPLGRPDINRWAIDTGPRLDLTHRVVLREIARYADDAPKTITVNGLLVHLEAGECCPTQETLAEGLDATDRTIRNSVRNLRGLGLLTTRPMPGADGKRLIYRLAGVDADWQPAPKNEKESRPIIAAYRILAEGQVQSLEEAHRRIAYLESLLNDRYGHPAATATGDGAQPNQTGPDPDTVAADELPNQNDIPVQQPDPTGPAPETVGEAKLSNRNVVPVQLPNHTGPAPENGAEDELSNQNEIPVQQPDPTGPAPETAAEAELSNRNVVPVHQPATEDDIAQTVRDNWPLLNRDKTWRKGINAAIRWYQEHPQELLAQLENLKLELEQELAAQAAAKPAKAPAALETVTTPGTAEARTMWAATLDRLEQELPRATFETWLRPTEGHSVQGNDLTVLVASPNNAEWLEQRVYQTILRKLRQGSDQKLDVRFALGPPDWSPPGAGKQAIAGAAPNPNHR